MLLNKIKLIVCLMLLNIPNAYSSIDCHRSAEEGELPFIKNSGATVILKVTQKEEGCQGVHFSHKKDQPSPHVTRTHVESVYHVYGGHKWGEAEKLSSVLAKNLDFKLPLIGLCLEVEVTRAEVIKEGSLWKMAGETYACDAGVAPDEFEHVITKASLKAIVDKISVLLPTQMIMIKAPLGECCSEGWPYLTNEAVDYLMGINHVRILALNLPSIDRERDNGATSNHKRVFTEPNRLVVEMANFEGLANQTYYVMHLGAQKSKFPDCAMSNLKAEPFPKVKIIGYPHNKKEFSK